MTDEEVRDAVWSARLGAEGRVFVLMPETQLAICKALVATDARLWFVRELLGGQVEELLATRCQQNHLHPDWSLLEASRESLRESWKRIKAFEEADQVAKDYASRISTAIGEMAFELGIDDEHALSDLETAEKMLLKLRSQR